MANEVLYSGLGDLTVSAVLARTIELLLADRASLRNSRHVVNVGDIAGSGSSASKQGYAGLDGYDEMAAVTEGSAVSNTALADGSQTVTVARQALQYAESDLANLILPDGSVDVERLAASMVGSAEMRLTTMLCSIIDDFTQTAGTSGADFTFAAFRSAIYQIERANAPTADLAAVLAPIQLTDLQADLVSQVGVVQWMQATQDMIQAKGQGLAGMLLGVEIHKSAKVVTSGGDRIGGMWHRGAVLMAEGSPKPLHTPGLAIYPAGTKVMVEFERDGSSALTKVIGNYYCGVAKNAVSPNELLGVSLTGSAT